MGYTITLAAGIILLIISLYLLQGSLEFIKKGSRATATVIAIEDVIDNDGTTYKPVFKFYTGLNKERIYRPNSSSKPSAWDVGDEATIVYDETNPADARLLTYFGAFSWTIILMAIAMPMLVVGGGYYIAQSFLR